MDLTNRSQVAILNSMYVSYPVGKMKIVDITLLSFFILFIADMSVMITYQSSIRDKLRVALYTAKSEISTLQKDKFPSQNLFDVEYLFILAELGASHAH